MDFVLGSEKEFDVTKARTHSPGCSVPMFKVECEDHSAIQAPQLSQIVIEKSVLQCCLPIHFDQKVGIKAQR